MIKGFKKLDITKDIDNICEVYKITIFDLIKIVEIYCKNISLLKEDYIENSYKYSVKKLNETKWAIIDNRKMSIVKYEKDELNAYRIARIKEELNKEINKVITINQKLYEEYQEEIN